MKFPFISKNKDGENIKMVEIDKISPNPYQPRNDFGENEIKELAESIDNFGILQPLTLRKKGAEFELIAGERRLRAAKLLNLDKVPCIINKFNDEEMAEIALVENIQRKDLDFIEEALAYSQLINRFNLTQKELAEKIGISQSTVANKLRLLQLSDNIKKKIHSFSLSERHARVLLKLDNEAVQLKVINKIKNNDLNVRETESYVKKLLDNKNQNDNDTSDLKNKNNNKKNNKITVYKDLRVFQNTLKSAINEMKEAGLDIKVEKNEEKDYVKYNIYLPKQ